MALSRGTSLVGLDVGTTGVRAAQVSVDRARSRYRVERVASLDLRRGIVEGGEIVDARQLAKNLKALWRRGRFTSRRVALGLPDRNLLTRQVDLPWMPPDDFRTALKYQVGDALPIDLALAEVDYQVLAEVTSADQRGQLLELNRTLVVASETAHVTEWAECLRRARLEPVVIDAPGFALIRSMSGGRVLSDHQVRAILDIGADQMTMVIYRDGQPLFLRSVARIGGDAATSRVAEALMGDLSEAEELKRATGLNGPPPDIAPVSESSVFAALAPSVAQPQDPRVSATIEALGSWATVLLAEVRNSLEYFRKSNPGMDISSLTVVGRTFLLPGLVERLATELALPVRSADPTAGLQVSRRLKAAPLDTRYVTAIGLAMGADL